MGQNAIVIRGLSKRYIVEEDRASTLKETLLRLFQPTAKDEIEAVRPLDLDVPRGEALGIIGQNGAGKSTLLKLIAGVTAPTTGSVEVDGTLMALIELGAGFHPDLSGMENIFLNGSVLGLSDKEIQGLLPRIVEFSGLDKFIHTPLKHYSSGMQMRLGFSVAAHIEPDIILLDENLAVGDLLFQAKCSEKIRDLRGRGKTILLVTHQLDLAEMLCDRVLWLREGRVVDSGHPGKMIRAYEDTVADLPIQKWGDDVRLDMRHAAQTGRFGTGEVVIREVSLYDAQGQRRHVLDEGEPFAIEVTFEAKREVPNLNVEISVTREDRLPILAVNAADEGRSLSVQTGPGAVRVALDKSYLRPGRYLVNVALSPDDNPSVFYDLHLYLHQFRIEARHETQLTTAVRVPCRINVRPRPAAGPPSAP
jgi:lipopolysaccharide transport system ATP-binding protein